MLILFPTRNLHLTQPIVGSVIHKSPDSFPLNYSLYIVVLQFTL